MFRGQDVGEPSLWIDAVELCRADQRIYNGGAVGAAIRLGEGRAFWIPSGLGISRRCLFETL